MSKTVVVFHSLHGNVRAVAQAVAEKTGADMVELSIPGAGKLHGFRMYARLGFLSTFRRSPAINGGDADISAYDTVIIGSPVWAGSFSPALRSFFTHRSLDGKKVVAFFCHKGGPGKAAAKLEAFLDSDNGITSLQRIEPLVHGEVDSFAAELVEATGD